MAIATYCNMRLPNVTAVLLGSDYKAYDVSAYKFNNSLRHILAISNYLPALLANLYCTCTKATIRELLVKILTLH